MSNLRHITVSLLAVSTLMALIGCGGQPKGEGLKDVKTLNGDVTKQKLDDPSTDKQTKEMIRRHMGGGSGGGNPNQPGGGSPSAPSGGN